MDTYDRIQLVLLVASIFLVSGGLYAQHLSEQAEVTKQESVLTVLESEQLTVCSVICPAQ